MRFTKAAIFVVILGIVIALVALWPKYAVGNMLCIQKPLTAVDSTTEVGTGRYRVVEADVASAFERMVGEARGNYGLVHIDGQGFESGGVLHAPAESLETNSWELSKASHSCP